MTDNTVEQNVDTQSRDRLALIRTQLANERTLLAYLRTAIMLAATGGTLLKLFGSDLVAVVSGWALIALAAAVGVIGAKRFHALCGGLK